MTIPRRLLRRPIPTLLWLLLTALASALLLVGVSLWDSTRQLIRTLDENSMAVAVRTDQEMVQEGQSLVLEERYFTEKDKAWLEKLDSVKGVRSHAMSAAAIPEMSPLIDMDRAAGYKALGPALPYSYAVFAARYTGAYNQDFFCNYYTMELESILLLGDEYARCGARTVLEEAGGFTVKVNQSWDMTGEDTAALLMDEGKRYIVAGYYDPGRVLFPPLVKEKKAPIIKNLQLYMNYLEPRGEEMISFNTYSVPLPEMGPNTYSIVKSELYCFPALEAWEGDPESFFRDTPHGIWRDFETAWQRQLHSFPVIGTDHLEAVYAFMAERALLKEGRSFTEEEYEQGARVAVISQRAAEQNGLKVGDAITLTQYLCLFNEEGVVSGSIRDRGSDQDWKPGMQAGSYYNDPSIDMMNLDPLPSREPESFTIVGTYELLSDWTYGPYDFGPNTIFIPRKAQMAGAFGEIPAEEGGADIYGLLLTVELKNGRMEDFMTALEGSSYERQFFAYDQGFEGVQKNLHNRLGSTRRLLALSLLAWVLFLLLYLLMYQGSEKGNLGIMRSLGEPARRCGIYHGGSGFAVLLTGLILGTAAGAFILDKVQQGILGDALASLDRTRKAAEIAAAETKLRTILENGRLETGELLLLAGLQLLLFALAILIHTRILCRKDPRQLMEG